MPKFISKVFSIFLSSYTLSFNKYEERNGSLFVPNFNVTLNHLCLEQVTYFESFSIFIQQLGDSN